MVKTLILLVLLVFAIGFSGMAFAGGDGFCSYQQQAKQVAAEKSDAAKSQAAQTAAQSETKSEADRFVLALDSANTLTPAEPQKK
jgi:cell division protein FtsB